MAEVPRASGEAFHEETARRGLKRGLWTIAALMAAILLVVLALGRTAPGAAAIAELAGRARPGLLSLALVSMTAAFFFMGLRWRALMPPESGARAGALMAIICAGLLLNYALPGPMGELGAAWLAGRRYRLPLAVTLASGVAARLVGLATAALTAAMVWLLADLPVPVEYRPLVGGAVVVIGVAGAALAALTARPEPWQALAQRLLQPLARRPGGVGRLAARLLGAFQRTTDDLREVVRQRPSAWLRAVGWSICSHGSVVLGVSFAVAAFGAKASLPGLLFTYATTTAGAVALFLLPGSQLGWDAMFMGLLVGSAGLPLVEASAVALLVRVHHLLVMLLGALSLVWLLGPRRAGSGRRG